MRRAMRRKCGAWERNALSKSRSVAGDSAGVPGAWILGRTTESGRSDGLVLALAADVAAQAREHGLRVSAPMVRAPILAPGRRVIGRRVVTVRSTCVSSAWQTSERAADACPFVARIADRAANGSRAIWPDFPSAREIWTL